MPVVGFETSNEPQFPFQIADIKMRVLDTADAIPPYSLPDPKNKSTIKSRPSIGGGGFNEIRFADKKGSEQVFVHAEKDQDIRVKNTRREFVGNERHLIVKKKKFELVEPALWSI